jgi:hypothetical protein
MCFIRLCGDRGLTQRPYKHYLIHQVEEIELCGLVHTRSMWMVERHLRSLKALVRQRAHPEGYMVEGYMVYQTLVYISDYLPDLGRKINMHCIWGVNNVKISEVKVLVENGKMRKVKGIILFDFYLYCISSIYIIPTSIIHAWLREFARSSPPLRPWPVGENVDPPPPA